MINVCKGCKPPDRCVEPNCHMSCEKYLNAKAEHDAKNEAERKMKKPFVDYADVKIRNIERTLRRVKR